MGVSDEEMEQGWMDATRDGAVEKKSSSTIKKKMIIKKKKIGSSSSSSRSSLKGILSVGLICCTVTFAAIVCGIIGSYIYLERWQQDQEIMYENKLKAKLEPLKKEWKSKVSALQKEMSQKEEKAEKLAQKKQNEEQEKDIKMEEAHRREVVTLQDHAKTVEKQKTQLETSVQRISEQYVLQKFGPGPHRVEIQLQFDPAEPMEGTEDKILLEMAPLSLMPHANYLFLSQVSLGLYNGTSFHRNARHVVQAGPATNFLTPPGAHPPYQAFKEHGLESVSFQEYSPEFPHVQYTVGYAGRPGGPDFYISVEDNSKIHGPGGQTSYKDLSEADPCFAKVIEGTEAVQRIHRLTTKPGNYRHLEHNVAIVYMRIQKDEKEEDEEDTIDVAKLGKPGVGADEVKDLELTKLDNPGSVKEEEIDKETLDISKIKKPGEAQIEEDTVNNGDSSNDMLDSTKMQQPGEAKKEIAKEQEGGETLDLSKTKQPGEVLQQADSDGDNEDLDPSKMKPPGIDNEAISKQEKDEEILDRSKTKPDPGTKVANMNILENKQAPSGGAKDESNSTKISGTGDKDSKEVKGSS